jgi:hypothetical protein
MNARRGTSAPRNYRDMTSADNQKKLASLRCGPYITPVVATGVVVECEVRGLVTVVGLSDAPLPWPLGERDGDTQPIVFKALARAIRQESPDAVAAAWGVTTSDVETWQMICRGPRRRKKQTRSSPPIPWKREDDDLIRHLSLAEAARLTGRTLTAVRKRRRALGLPDGRRAAERAIRIEETLESQAAAASQILRERTHKLTGSLAELQETFRRAHARVAFWRACPPPARLVNDLGEVLDAEFTEFGEPTGPTDQFGNLAES